jgi:uncharacterized protein YaiE (UPF0345 family)
MSVTINASTSSGLVQTADTSGTVEIQSNGTTKFTVASTGAYGQITSGTAVASTSGTSIDFTSLPTWVKRITVMLSGVSTNGTANLRFQIGTGGSPTTSGYAGSNQWQKASAGASASNSSGIDFNSNASAATTYVGNIVCVNITGNTWVITGQLGNENDTSNQWSSGKIALAGVLNMVRVTSANGTDTFDAGTINILYEG